MSADVPAGLSEGGANLWRCLISQDETLEDEMNPNRFNALNACRAQDRCDSLYEVWSTEPVMLDNGKGQPIAHPAWVEARQQEALVARLTAVLRLPDEATGKRPQRRQIRGVQQPSTAPVSSLERLRAAKSS